MFDLAFYRKYITILLVGSMWTTLLLISLVVEMITGDQSINVKTDFVPLLLFLFVLNVLMALLVVIHHKKFIKEHMRRITPTHPQTNP